LLLRYFYQRSVVVGVSELKRFKIHTFRHRQLPNFLIHYANWLHLHRGLSLAVGAVLTAAAPSALHPSREATAVFFIALGAFACAGHLGEFHRIRLALTLHDSFPPQTLVFDALLAAVALGAVFLEVQGTGTGFAFAGQVTQTDMADIFLLFIRETLFGFGLHLEASPERIELVFDWFCLGWGWSAFSEYLFVEVGLPGALETHNSAWGRNYSKRQWFLVREWSRELQLLRSSERQEEGCDWRERLLNLLEYLTASSAYIRS
jgi:hypothetical protein